MESILVFFAVYLAIYLTMNLVAIRYRRRLVVAVEKAKNETDDPKTHRLLDSFQVSMTSMRTAVILCAIFVQMLLEPKAKIEAAIAEKGDTDPLYASGLMGEILECHMASAAAVNPLFGLAAYVTRFFAHHRFGNIIGENGSAREVRSITSRYAAC